MANRRSTGTRDMIITMAVVLVVVGLIALYGSRVSIGVGPDAGSSALPSAQVTGGFTRAQCTLEFPITVPGEVPDSWHPNSFSLSDPAAPHHSDATVVLATVRGGWITPDDQYVELIESAGKPGQVMAVEFDHALASTTTVDAGGATWKVATGVRSESAWVRMSGDTTFVITGDATPDDFAALATAVAGAPGPRPVDCETAPSE